MAAAPFSGAVRQIEESFDTEIHAYELGGERHVRRTPHISRFRMRWRQLWPA
jgi:hypothetical protein